MSYIKFKFKRLHSLAKYQMDTTEISFDFLCKSRQFNCWNGLEINFKS